MFFFVRPPTYQRSNSPPWSSQVTWPRRRARRCASPSPVMGIVCHLSRPACPLTYRGIPGIPRRCEHGPRILRRARSRRSLPQRELCREQRATCPRAVSSLLGSEPREIGIFQERFPIRSQRGDNRFAVKARSAGRGARPSRSGLVPRDRAAAAHTRRARLWSRTRFASDNKKSRPFRRQSQSASRGSRCPPRSSSRPAAHRVRPLGIDGKPLAMWAGAETELCFAVIYPWCCVPPLI